MNITIDLEFWYKFSEFLKSRAHTINSERNFTILFYVLFYFFHTVAESFFSLLYIVPTSQDFPK